MNTYHTKYGLITLMKNEVYIGNTFKNGKYWDESTLLLLRKYINPSRNVLEIGGHCGTSTIVYASFIHDNRQVFVYEPQPKMYALLVHNVIQNNLLHKIVPTNKGVFCCEGPGNMNKYDLDGGGGEVAKRYTEEQNLACNFGGICLGQDGEAIQLTTIDAMQLDNVGFIHCDAQGSESFIFSKGIETIKRCRPVIIYENNVKYGRYLYDNVCNSYPQYKEEGEFDIQKYCMEELKYSKCIEGFNGGIDSLLIP
jgi:FkbM family methyltransferase